MNHNLKTAIDARRLHHQLYPEYLEVEDGFSQVNLSFDFYLSMFIKEKSIIFNLLLSSLKNI